MNNTERTIYVAVLVVEHTPGLGPELDHVEAGHPGWGSSVRGNLVDWIDGVLTPENANDDGSLFYAVRDVTLYSADDLALELAEHGSIDKFPDVITEPEAQ